MSQEPTPGENEPTPPQGGTPGSGPQPGGAGQPGGDADEPAGGSRASSSGTGTSIGLEPNIAGLGAYLLGWISGLILLLVEKEHQEVRFHAAQSLIVSVALIAVFIVFSILTMIPVLGLIFVLVQVLLGLASLALWIYLLIQGYNLNHVKLPVVGDYAEQLAAKELG